MTIKDDIDRTVEAGDIIGKKKPNLAREGML